MKTDVIGIGSIAGRAHLPAYAKKQGTVGFYFVTRNKETKKRIQEEYRFQRLYETTDKLLGEEIRTCMIHAATKAHYELAKRCLEDGTRVCIGKLLNVHLNEVRELQELAGKSQAIPMTGFGRHFAPMVEELKCALKGRLIQL